MQFRSLLTMLIVELSRSYNLDSLFNDIEPDSELYYMNHRGIYKCSCKGCKPRRSFKNCIIVKINYMGANITSKLFSNGLMTIIYASRDRTVDEDMIRVITNKLNIKHKYCVMDRYFQYIFNINTLKQSDGIVSMFNSSENSIKRSANGTINININGVKIIIFKKNLMFILCKNKSVYNIIDHFEKYRRIGY